MAKEKKKKTQPKKTFSYIDGSYGIPRIIVRGESPAPGYPVAFVEAQNDGELKYFKPDEESGEEYEISKSDAWLEYYDRLFEGAMSHDIIPAFDKLLTNQSWKVPFDSNMEAFWDFQEYKEDYTNIENLKLLPKTHDDWLASLVARWRNKQCWSNYTLLLQFEEPYPYLQYPNSEMRFTCEISLQNELRILNYCLDDLESEETEAEDVITIKETIHDFIAIAPSLSNNNNSSVLQIFTQQKRQHPQFISDAIREAVENIKNELAGREEKYLADVYEFIQQIDAAD
ncbi:hypothetical protein IQ264_14160 [Phormidium sp. LEGE 05292]|uniref:hypothetical protein n=1 Tax=[Phormidium] sp. LEGE 05292 TaxID=767427 RepID=UPI0018816E0C|nr:hypothetical protein [Phormidium sp. LEGE 05292]MBE9226568.1 hypothetical protein [Phormidium sp. LEGE 05292]